MGILQTLAVLAVRQVANGALQAVGVSGGGDAVATFLTERFTDHSQRLTTALQAANERSWKAMEVALAGESLWDKCKVTLAPGEDQAFRQQLRAFLDASPLTKASAEHAQVFKQALQELRAARSRGLLAGGRLAPDALAREAGAFASFSDPQALLDAEWKVIDKAAGEARQLCPNLWKVLVARTKSGSRPSILAVAVRYYFRREVETDRELFQGLAFAKLEALQDAQEKAFAGLSDALAWQGQRLEGMLGDVLQVTAAIKQTGEDTNARVRAIEEQIQKLLERLQLHGRELRPGDSMSVRSEGEQRHVERLVNEYRALPEDQRRGRPEVQTKLGVLEAAAGQLEDAQKDFQEAARSLADPQARAEAHHNAYRAALERRRWPEALDALRQAVALAPARFAPFPFERYEPQRLLGAGGFGAVFLCQHRHLGRPVVVKALLASELDRNITDVFAEARALEDVDHPAIVSLRDCDYADAAKGRPYLVMDFFDGQNLADYVEANGPLSPEDALAVARPVAEALRAAHAKGICHRDVKSGNMLVRREAGGWKVKLIDFGLALRPEALQGKESTASPQARTTLGRSVAGTLHYAAPEQMGDLPGVPVGAHSDVWGFGRTCYFALLGTPEPDDLEKETLPEGWRRLLARCTVRKVENRLPDFGAVLAGLAKVGETPPAEVVPIAPPPAITGKGKKSGPAAKPTKDTPGAPKDAPGAGGGRPAVATGKGENEGEPEGVEDEGGGGDEPVDDDSSGKAIKNWPRDEYLALLEKTRQGKGDGVAEANAVRKIIEWGDANKLRLSVWGHEAYGSFFPVLRHEGKDRWACGVYTYGTVEVPFRWMKARPPFDLEEKRRELLRRLNEIPGVGIAESSIGGLPTFPLSAITDEASLKQFLAVLDWFYAEVRADLGGEGGEPDDDEAGSEKPIKDWPRDKFLGLLEETRRARGDAAAEVGVVRRLLAWLDARGIKTSIWKAKTKASLFPVLRHKDPAAQSIKTDIWACVVRTDGKVEIPFRHILRRPPFDNEEKRREMLRRLNQVPGVTIAESSLDKLPNVPLAVCTDEAAFGKLLEVLAWFYAEAGAS